MSYANKVSNACYQEAPGTTTRNVGRGPSKAQKRIKRYYKKLGAREDKRQHFASFEDGNNNR